MNLIPLYSAITKGLGFVFDQALTRRLARGKESQDRLEERRGVASRARPDGKLVWLHAASVGEAQSALIVVSQLLESYSDMHVLVTSGTLTSAEMMDRNLPDRAFHQFVPLDRPDWVKRFLNHWRPDFALWMESELWPNMLTEIKSRGIPAVLLNARMSERSLEKWQWIGGSARALLSAFNMILAQTGDDALRYEALGHGAVHMSDNIKFSAAPLQFDEADLMALKDIIGKRPVWLYASTHAGEESLACQTHLALIKQFPDTLTILVPRHPERRTDILKECEAAALKTQLRGAEKSLPDKETQIYIADTLGELGLFYRLAPISMIGRSFSDDGGGGHNPIEAAQLGTGILYGPHVQYQQELFDTLQDYHGALMVREKEDLPHAITKLLLDRQALRSLQLSGQKFADAKAKIIDHVMERLHPLLEKALT